MILWPHRIQKEVYSYKYDDEIINECFSHCRKGSAASPGMSQHRPGSAAAFIPTLRVLWLDANIEKLKKDHSPAFSFLQKLCISLRYFVESDLFVNLLFENTNKRYVAIVSGDMGQSTIPVIHDAPQIQAIFILCEKRAHHEQWTRTWSKVQGVFDRIDNLCQAVEQTLKHPGNDSDRVGSSRLHPPSSDRRSRTPEPTTPTKIHRDKTPVLHDRNPYDFGLNKNEDKESKRKPSESDRHALKPQHRKDAIPAPIAIPKNDNESERSLLNSLSPAGASATNQKNQISPAIAQLENNLAEAAERKLRESLLITNDKDQGDLADDSRAKALKETFIQAITKHAAKKSNDPAEINKMFNEMKQQLIETILQQQSALLQDVIRQSVHDALKLQQTLISPNPATTLQQQTRDRKPVAIKTSQEIIIVANTKLTRVDATFRKQRDAIVANKKLRDAVDQWSLVNSMADLTTAIKSCGSTSMEYAWLIFCWIGKNIQYQPYCNNNAAETVFRTRQGVCRGFASLYHECCSLLNIQCSEISGYAKQSFLKPGEELKQSPHAWNSIVLDGYTYLVDPTWGAGGRENERKLEEFYFLTSPEEFIYTHYVNGYQLLDPEITKKDFISLPVMKSTYYRYGLTLLSPKQGLNETNQNLFKIIIKTPEHVDLLANLKVGDTEYPTSLHTLCQRDQNKPEHCNCLIAPPLDGLYEVIIYAKEKGEKTYTDAIYMRLRVSDIFDAFMFPIVYSTFTEQRCILIEPLRRLVRENEQVLIHMIIPKANVLTIRNGEDTMVPHSDEYKDGVLKKTVRVQGDLQICGRWDDKADSISIICIFTMI